MNVFVGFSPTPAGVQVAQDWGGNHCTISGYKLYTANNNPSTDKSLAITCVEICLDKFACMFQYISVQFEFHLWFLRSSYGENVSWFCSLV